MWLIAKVVVEKHHIPSEMVDVAAEITRVAPHVRAHFQRKFVVGTAIKRAGSKLLGAGRAGADT